MTYNSIYNDRLERPPCTDRHRRDPSKPGTTTGTGRSGAAARSEDLKIRRSPKKRLNFPFVCWVSMDIYIYICIYIIYIIYITLEIP